MSRASIPLNSTTEIHRGSDHALGYFFDITDTRYAGTKHDPQGEGYLVEWSHVFGFSNNQIGIKKEELGDEQRINELIDNFLKEKGLV